MVFYDMLALLTKSARSRRDPAVILLRLDLSLASVVHLHNWDHRANDRGTYIDRSRRDLADLSHDPVGLETRFARQSN